MVQIRTRTRQRSKTQGYQKLNGVVGTASYISFDQSCTDSYKKTVRDDGSLPPTALTLRTTRVTPALLSFQKGNLVNGYSLTDVAYGMPMGTSLSYSSPAGGWSTLEGSDSSLVAKLLANTNPFRYEVSVPIMISELAEAATLLKLATNNMYSLTGSGYLNWAFGWKLMLNDIRKLSLITKLIESRIREFNSLVSKGGLRRSVQLTSGTKVNATTSGVTYSSSAGTCSCNLTASYHTKVWGSVRWKPVRGQEIAVAQLANFNDMLIVVLDLQLPDASTMWESIPFSWLADYFLNVGDTLLALENSDEVEPYDICIMRHRQITYSYEPKPGGLNANVHNTGLPGNWLEGRASAGKVVHDFKIRTIHSSSRRDLLSFGFMTKNQATNLMALLYSLARFKK